MRIDKFLKVSRVIKRRTVANDACDGDHVSVNGKTAKASYTEVSLMKNTTREIRKNILKLFDTN